MTTMPIYALVDTWDAAGTTFKGISLDITDTASAAGSLLMDLQVGGVSKFQITKAGRVAAGAGYLYGNPQFYDFSVGTGLGVGISGSDVTTYINSAATFSVGSQSTGVRLAEDTSLGWTLSHAIASNPDLRLFRDAANTLAQRNGVNAQAFRVYNSFTDGSNLERGKFAWESNILRIGTEKLGAGTARALELQTDGVTAVTVSNNQEVRVNTDQFVVQRKAGGGEYGQIAFGTTNAGNHAVLTSDYFRFRNRAATAGAFLEMIEQTAPAAPAANEVRIYAVDNGSGKTQLMALFATGAAQQIAIEP